MESRDDLLTSAETAELVRVTQQALEVWRREGRGPTYVRIGPRSYRYRRGDLEDWLAECRVTPERA